MDMELKMELIISLLKTHGVLRGEIKDMSKSGPITFVVFYYLHLTQPRLPQWNDLRDNEQNLN